MLLKYITCLVKLNVGATCADQTGNAQTNLHTYCPYMSQETASHKLFLSITLKALNYVYALILLQCVLEQNMKTNTKRFI